MTYHTQYSHSYVLVPVRVRFVRIGDWPGAQTPDPRPKGFFGGAAATAMRTIQPSSADLSAIKPGTNYVLVP
eukprot:scaffold340547_cov39-Prasinocladus_malaysianus.AAC.1